MRLYMSPSDLPYYPSTVLASPDSGRQNTRYSVETIESVGSARACLSDRYIDPREIGWGQMTNSQFSILNSS